MVQAITATGICLVIGPIAGLIAVGAFTRLLRQRWLPDEDTVTRVVLAAVIVVAAWLASFHLHAFGRMFGWLPGLSVSGITLVFLVLIGAAWRVLRRYGSEQISPSDVRPARWRWMDWLCIVPVILAQLMLLADALTRTPTGHDGLKYRLPLVVTWLRTDALIMNPDIWQFCQPGNGELVLWWLLKGGAEHLASAAYFPAGLLMGGAVWAIVRIQRGSRFAGVLAVATALSTHLVVWQMYNAYVDLFGTAFLASGIVAFLLATAKDRSPSARRLLFVIAGLALGIALGSKPVNWTLAFVTAILFLGVHLYRNRRQHDLAFVLPAFGLACLACSAFWFVRAGIETGNPLYPVRVAVGDRVLLKGIHFAGHYEIYEDNDKTTPFTAGVLDRWGKSAGKLFRYAVTLNTLSGGVGPVFTMFVPIAAAVAVVGLLLRGRRAMRHGRLVIVALTGLLFALWVGPLCHYDRFGMIYLVLAVCVAAPVIGWVHRHWPRTMITASFLGTCLACAMIAAVPCRHLCGRLRSGDFSRSGFYGFPPVVDEWPAGTRVINLTPWPGASTFTYPLYGRGLKNDVIDYMTTKALFPELKPTVEQLQTLGVQYVVVCYPFRREWPADSRLELVHDDLTKPRHLHKLPLTRIYRVPPGTPGEVRTVVLGKPPV